MSTTLVIKSPTQQVKDQKIECQLTWSVDQLKDYISQEYPTKPNKESQKLIYCGQLLPDNVKLIDILHHEGNEVHTLHLVCHQSNQGSNSQVADKNLASHTDNMNSTPPPISLPSSDTGADGIRQRRNNPERSFNPVPPVSSNFPVTPVDVPSQMALMQQAYAQYMSQYLMYIQSGGSSYFASPFMNTIPTTEPSSTPEYNQDSGVQNGPGNQNAGVEVQAPPPPPQPPAAAVAQQNDDDADANGDVLDYIYILSRFLILASILYIYSSFGRILLVSGLALLLYLYHNGRLSRRRGRNVSQTAAVPNNGNEDPNRTPNEQGGVQEDSDGQEQGVGETEQNTSESNANDTRSETSPVTAVWTFLSAFFSSLIPEQPIPVNIN